MDSWTRYFYEQHSQTELKEWASRLKMFRYFRAIGGHANDGDSLDVALKYETIEELVTLLNKLGIAYKNYQKKPDQPILNKQYSSDIMASFPSLIEGTEWIEQPGTCEVFGVKVYVRCSSGVVYISIRQENYMITNKSIESAEQLEKNLQAFSDIVLDPPRDTKHYLCPKYHPSFFNEAEKPKPRVVAAPEIQSRSENSKGVKQLDNDQAALLSSSVRTNHNTLIDSLADYPDLQAVLKDDKPAIELPSGEHWIIRLNFLIRFIRVLISPFR